MSGIDFWNQALEAEGVNPYLMLAAIHLPIALAIVIGLVTWWRQRQEERRLWSPAVMYPYVVPGRE